MIIFDDTIVFAGYIAIFVPVIVFRIKAIYNLCKEPVDRNYDIFENNMKYMARESIIADRIKEIKLRTDIREADLNNRFGIQSVIYYQKTQLR